jgi:hypothetical protein
MNETIIIYKGKAIYFDGLYRIDGMEGGSFDIDLLLDIIDEMA